ncbi:hypothetical protein TRFO_17645 [Tritrichomonas foetus]|uniref:Uncharacterized protein n=1 Tax=Tritrichomonas foetus TaxID=1144522 RepID=A0A1J4KMF2_9EUKA|nr:hypothetical protein TRFO_17645 [Tritrichomonas foetus]|eukprot:OHT12487.1 hypothetical protein TRFO_17645 [Tritrichomonas foetus]
MFLLTLAIFAISGPTEHSITVCQGSCPDHAIGDKIPYDETIDLSTILDKSLSYSTKIYFYSTSRNFVFEFRLNIFDGHIVEFLRLDSSSIVDLEIASTNTISSGKLIFHDIDVKFVSTQPMKNLTVGALELDHVQVDLVEIEELLVVGTLITDDSVHSFEHVQLTGISYYEEAGVLLDMTSGSNTSIIAKDYSFEATINNKKTTFTYMKETALRADLKINAHSTLVMKYEGTSPDKIPAFEFSNFESLEFSGEWPATLKLPVYDKDISSMTLIASGSVLPVTKTGCLANIVLSQAKTTITGDFSCDIKLSTTLKLQRATATFKGTFSGESLDLGSSYIDATVAKVATDLSLGDFPFVFRVGTGGSSTIVVEAATTSQTKMTGIVVVPDFTTYLSDDLLSELINHELTIMTIKNIIFKLQYAYVSLPDSPFIHGFTDGDSCLTAKVVQDHVTLTAVPPSTLPLNICYDGDRLAGECDGSDGIEIYDIELITDYFVDGMKYLNLTIKTFTLNYLDFSRFDYGYTDVKVIVRGGLSNTKVERMSFITGSGITDLELHNLKLGDVDFYVKKILFDKVTGESYSKFSFHSCEQVLGDDYFIRNVLPYADPLYKIPKLTYTMDVYDAMTVSDDSYIFYDFESNDLFQPVTINSEIVGFLDIIYDVGITQTAERNNFNVTMNTKTPPSLNISFKQISLGYWETAELILYSWKQTSSASFTVNFDHGDLPVNIVLTEPYKPSQIKPIGSGPVTWVNRYGDGVEFCVSDDSDKSGCPSRSQHILPANLNSELTKTTKSNITVYLVKITDSNKPTLDLSNVNAKVSTFIGKTSGTKDVIEIQAGSSQVDIKTTTTKFENLVVKSASGATSLSFGELDFLNCEIDSSFKNTAITVDDFTCQYEILSKFKSILIKDNCIVNGELSTVASTVQFDEDENSNDLQATISSDAQIVMVDKGIKIGATTFLFKTVEAVYDVVLTVSSGKTITVTKDSGVKEDNMPVVLVKKCAGAIFNFGSGWNEGSRTHIFIFYEFSGCTFSLASQHTPLSFSADDGDFTLVGKAAEVGITGHIEYRDIQKSNTITVKYESVSSSKISIKNSINIGGGAIFKFSQPNIELHVHQISGSKRDKAVIECQHFSSTDGDSRLTIEEALINAIISPNYQIQMPITKSIDDSSVVSYFNKNHTFIKVDVGDVYSCQVSNIKLIGTQPTTHGFVESNLWIAVNEDTGDIYMYFVESPLLIPFNLCYGASGNCEITLTDSTISSIDTLLPNGAKAIQARFGKSNSKDFALNFDKIKGASVTIIQYGSVTVDVKVTLGSGFVSTLSLEGVSVKVSDSSFSVNSLELKSRAKIDKIDGFQAASIDYATWSNSEFPSFTKDLTLIMNTELLTFTASGWKVGTSSIAASKYPKFKFNFEGYSPQLEVENGVTSVKGTTISGRSTMVTVGSNWGSITGETVEFVSTDLSKVKVTTSSFPFTAIPKLMSAGTVQFDKSTLPFQALDTINLNNINSTLDFGNAAHGTGKMDAKSIIFDGKSSLSAKNAESSYPISATRVEINSKSQTNLSQTTVSSYLGLHGASSLTGSFDLQASASVELLWKLNEIPEIIFTEDPTTEPLKVILKFDDSDYKDREKDYDNYLYHNTFSLIRLSQNKCSKWLSKFETEAVVDCFGSKPIFDFSCNGESLVLYGRDHVSFDGDDSGDSDKKKLSGGAIAAIVIVVLAVVAGGAYGGYYYWTKRRDIAFLNSELLDSKIGDAKFIDNTI